MPCCYRQSQIASSYNEGKKGKKLKNKFFPRIGLRSNTNEPFDSTEKNIQNVFSNKSTEKSTFLKKLSAKNFDFRFFFHIQISYFRTAEECPVYTEILSKNVQQQSAF